MTTKPQKTDKETFEKSLERLETIVRELESGERGLEESLSLFEGGIALVRQLSSRLEAAKHRVEVLTKDSRGALRADPLEEDAEG